MIFKANPARLGVCRKKLSAEQVEQAVALYQEGHSLQVLAVQFDVTRQAMWDLLRRRIDLRPQKRNGADNHFFRGGVRSDPRAHDEFEHALRIGRVVRVSHCEECGASPVGADGRTLVVGHHDDYNFPLSVRWLCQPCHHEWHRNNEPVMRRQA